MGVLADLDSGGIAARAEALASRLLARPAFWAVLVAALVSWPVARAVRTALPPPLPVLAELPRFDLTHENGRPFGTGRDYARSHHASPRPRSFLTGPEEAVKRAVVGGLKVAMGKERSDDGSEGIFHGSHLVLVDARGRVRGYYDPEEPGAADRVVRDAGLLANQRD